MAQETKKIKTELTKKEYDLIIFIRNELPFGKCFLITHNGQPERVEDPKKIRFFKGNSPSALDKVSEEEV